MRFLGLGTTPGSIKERQWIETIARFMNGEIENLMILAPPRADKTIFTDMVFKHHMKYHPEDQIGYFASCEYLSEKNRKRLFIGPPPSQYCIRPVEYMALGGRYIGLTIIDDPIYNLARTASSRVERLWEWCVEYCWHRTQNHGQKLIVSATSGKGDFIHKVLEEEKEEWVVLGNPADSNIRELACNHRKKVVWERYPLKKI